MPRRASFRLPFTFGLLSACAEPDAPTGAGNPSFDHDPLHIVVNSTADPGDGTCDGTECTLREALAIIPAGGRIDFSVSGTITLAFTSGGLMVDRSVIVAGPAEPGISVDGSRPPRSVFTIAPGVVARLSRLTIRGGGRNEGGGGIRNQGDLSLANVLITENEGELQGGGILNETGATLQVRNSTISGNEGFEGGGVNNRPGGDVLIVNSTIEMNTGADGAGIINRGEMRLVSSTVANNRGSAGIGGGIYNAPNGSLLVTNSTISGNMSAQGAIGMDGGQVVLQNVTVTGNRSGNGGGGFYVDGGALDLDNTLVALNVLDNPTEPGPDMEYRSGALTARFSLLGTADGHPLTDGPFGNQVGVSPAELNLGPLAFNGGPTRTHALGAGSVAIDAGRLRRCPEVDQRGLGRPAGGDCDIGSYEFQPLISFSGFLPPLLSPPEINVVTPGATVSLQFRLKGVQGQAVLAPKSPFSQPIRCGSRVPTGAESSTTSRNGVGLLYDQQTDRYTYPWQTTKQWAGSCRQFLLRLSDGSTYQADFDFREQ